VVDSCTDHALSHPPLFDVALAITGPHVAMEPSPWDVANVLTHVLDDMISGVRSMQTIDATLMALLHLPVSDEAREAACAPLGVRKQDMASVLRRCSEPNGVILCRNPNRSA
jgi:hypothetical protein